MGLPTQEQIVEACDWHFHATGILAIEVIQPHNIGMSSDSLDENDAATILIKEKIQEYASLVSSSDPDSQLQGAEEFRKLLTEERTQSPILLQAVIDSGVISRFVLLLADDNVSNHKLQHEVVWALTSLTHGNVYNVKSVIDAGALLPFLRLLSSSSSSEDVHEQCLIVLGNIAGHSVAYRDQVLNLAALPTVLHLFGKITEKSSIGMVRAVAYALRRFTAGDPSYNFEILRTALPTLQRLLYSEDEKVLADVCEALGNLDDGPNHCIQAIIDIGVTPRLVELLHYTSSLVQGKALRAIANIFTGDETQTQYVLNLGVLSSLTRLLDHSDIHICKETYWALSNITAGNVSQIQMVFDTGVISKLLEVMKTAESMVQKEIAWVVSNATSGGNTSQILFLARAGAVASLCSLLKTEDANVLAVSLEGLENILRTALTLDELQTAEIYEMMLACNAIEVIKERQNHEDDSIQGRAANFLEVVEDVKKNYVDTGYVLK